VRQGAEAAVRFYAETFPDSAVGAVHRAPNGYLAGMAGDVLVVEFTVAGVACVRNYQNLKTDSILLPSRSSTNAA
jgi:predicted 3-demethylubiquinone-9 3-methyltransferase (glyoxalase superfamily)